MSGSLGMRRRGDPITLGQGHRCAQVFPIGSGKRPQASSDSDIPLRHGHAERAGAGSFIGESGHRGYSGLWWARVRGAA